jgi:hypothetical protein
MEYDEVKQLVAMAQGLLGQAMRLHDTALRLAGGQQTPQARMNALFSRSLDEPAETRLVPYRRVQPGIAFGFEDRDGFAAVLREVPREGAYNRVQIEVQDIGSSRWFALEVDLSWPSIRPADSLDIVIAAIASHELGCSATLTAFDLDGARHDLGRAPLFLQPTTGPARATLEYALPEATLINFELEPKLILFFPVERLVLDVDYIELRTR